MAVVPHPLYYSLFPRLKIKLKSSHFDTLEMMEAESQAVLYTLTEHDFSDAFKKDTNAGNGAHARNGTTSRMMVASRPGVNFLADGSIVPGNYGWFFVFLFLSLPVGIFS
jgi:hypothetical protein